MHFARSEEQSELATIVSSLLTRHADPATIRATFDSGQGYDPQLWERLVEQVGAAALCIPDEFGGFGASLVETAVVLEELGKSGAPTPLLASTLTAANLLLHGSEEDKSTQLPELAAGAIKPFTLGSVTLEPTERVESMDQALRVAPTTSPGEVPDDVRDIAVALISALQVGTMQRALDMTVAYSKERVQFGRPIGSFQALKHRMADMLVLVEASRSASWGATAAAASYLNDPSDPNRVTLQRQAAVAGAYCADAGADVVGEMIQLHGGIAITWEHDSHYVFKRTYSLNQLAGTAHEHRAAALATL